MLVPILIRRSRPTGPARAALLAMATCCAALATSPPTDAAILHVPADQARITDALALAAPGDSILVGPGLYSPSSSGEVFPLVLGTSDVALLGAGPDQCVLDAGNFGSVIRITAPSGGRVSGFAVTGGNAYNGGGIRIEGGAPEIDGNVIHDNRARNFGSGIHLTAGAAPWIHHNVLWENTDVDLGDPGDPHGIQLEGAGGVIEHNLIGRHDSNGLLVANGDEPIIRNNIFFENGIPGMRGRGICNFGGPGTVIAHNLFHGNVIAAILVNPGSFMDLSGAAANALDPADGTYGNLDGDPRFVDPDASLWTLFYDSPAIDAGDPLSPLDPDGTPADIGPFPFNQSVTGIGGERTPAASITSAPNPFRTDTRVSFGVAAEGFTRVEVFDARGRRVRRLFEGPLGPGGTRSLLWNGQDELGRGLGAGVYFLRVSSPAGAAVQRVVLAR